VPVNIGAKAQSSFGDPIGLLGDCHRRIESFLGVLVKAAEIGPERMGDAERKSLQRALNHFRDAAPKHTADEEESVFPRLRAAAAKGDPGAVSSLEKLESDHAGAEELHLELDQLGREWLGTGTLPPQRFDRFGRIARQLLEIYTRHIAIEDTEVFPLAQQLLHEAELKAIGKEMAARRAIHPTP
jgi:hemerythrin-like domain-containing protein